MPARSPQRLLDEGRARGVSEEILKSYIKTAEITARHGDAPPITTLKHLSHETGIGVRFLRDVVAREGHDTYREFAIHKRPLPGKPVRKRWIAIPEPRLMTTQRWIAREILARAPCHSASVAYAPGNRLVDAARRHRNARWLVKIDVRSFFESLTEIDAYRAFSSLGYQPLVAFELSRLCTRLRNAHRDASWRLPERRTVKRPYRSTIDAYRNPVLGVLPQGAPTSPMLANIAARPLDEDLAAVAADLGVCYTRYADDLAFSTDDKRFGREACVRLVGAVYEGLGRHGLEPNVAKTEIAPVGARKIVLGLLVDGTRPRLPRRFRQDLRMHLHYITHPAIGPTAHAGKRGFASVEGLRQHLLGLIAFAGQIDPVFADACRTQMRKVAWP